MDNALWKGHDRILAQYLDPWLTSFYPDGDITPRLTIKDLTTPDQPLSPLPTPDSNLASLAQLGALRLGFKRAIINLVGRREQRVLAEATQTSPLIPSDEDEVKDNLWIGCCVLPTSATIEGQLMTEWLADAGARKIRRATVTASQIKQGQKYTAPDAQILHDMGKHDNLKTLTLVQAPFNAKFYVGIPIVDVSGHVIGIYALHDDVPHDLCLQDIRFLQHMSKTVSTYLANVGTKLKQTRNERLVRGLALFTEGKSSLREWFVEEEHRNQMSQSNSVPDDEDLADIADEATSRYGPAHETESSIESRRRSQHTDRTMPSFALASHVRTKRSHSDFDSDTDSLPDGRRKPARAKATHTHASGEHQRITPSPNHDVNRAFGPVPDYISILFSRASNLIREACGFDGVIMYDGGGGLQVGGSSGDITRATAGIDPISTQAPHPNQVEHTSDSSDHESPSATSQAAAKDTAECSILAFSSTVRSSLAGNESSRSHRSLSREAMRKLIKRYRSGKYFHFDQGEAVSSSSSESMSGASNATRRALRGKRLQEFRRMQDIAGEDVNSVVFLPLWDWYRNRWFAGLFAWTTSSVRAIDSLEELQYLKAFGNCVMTELARIDAATSDFAKNKFISSISHELRSPMHGILAGTEILESMDPQGFASSVVATIDSCGKTLLDTINNLLEFSGINNFEPPRESEKDGRKPHSIVAKPNADVNILVEPLDPSLVAEEVLETVLVGLQPAAGLPGVDDGNDSSSEVLDIDEFSRFPYIVFDFDSTTPNEFFMPSGGWRRVLLNLISNAIKFTTEGYIGIKITAEKQDNGASADHVLILGVEDTGRGISQEFLRHQLFTPFVQEDILSPGTGLGLHLTQQLVQDYGGVLQVRSTVGEGTSFTAKIPVNKSYGTPDEQTLKELRFSIRERTRDRTVSLMFSSPRKSTDLRRKAAKMALESLETLLKDWFHMQTYRIEDVSQAIYEYMIMTDEEFDDIIHENPEFVEQIEKEERKGILVLCYNLRYAAKAAQRYPKIEFITPPFGTRSISKSLSRKLEILEHEEESKRRDGGKEALAHDTQSNDTSSHNHSQHQSMPTSWDDPVSPSMFHHSFIPSIPDPSSTKPEGAETTPVTPRLLLVEDNDINMKFLVAFAMKHKLQYDCANNGLEAVNHYKKRNCDFGVIFMDISMPIMDGLTATRKIRESELETCPPYKTHIIALTGVVSETARQEASQAGCDIFLSKPASLKKLKEIVDDVTKKRVEGGDKNEDKSKEEGKGKEQ